MHAPCRSPHNRLAEAAIASQRPFCQALRKGSACNAVYRHVVNICQSIEIMAMSPMQRFDSAMKGPHLPDDADGRGRSGIDARNVGKDALTLSPNGVEVNSQGREPLEIAAFKP